MAAADILAVLAYEAFSVPSSVPHLTPSVELVSVADSQPFVDLQVFCVQESCGFGFVLHRRAVFLLYEKAAAPASSSKDRVVGHRLFGWGWRG